jgi:hypothetical protein
MFSQDVLTAIRSIFAKKQSAAAVGARKSIGFQNTTKKRSHSICVCLLSNFLNEFENYFYPYLSAIKSANKRPDFMAAFIRTIH